MEESKVPKIMEEKDDPKRTEVKEDSKIMEEKEDPKRMEESPPKRMEYGELNLKNRRGLSITVRILWCILTIISAFLVQKNNWINLVISLTTGELIGYITMKTLTSTKIMISPKTIWIHLVDGINWIHIVDGINTGVPIASTITLYYLEDVSDWATILRGTLGVFISSSFLGCLYRFFGYISFPAILISIVFGGGCILLILITHLGEKGMEHEGVLHNTGGFWQKKNVGGMGHEGENNMDMDISKTWSLKEEIRTNREKKEWLDLGLKALGIGTPLGFAIYQYFTYRSTFYIPLFFLLLQLFLLSCIFTTFSFLNNIFRMYITSFIDIMHRTKTLLILGIVFGGVIYMWSLMGVGSLSQKYSLTDTTHILFNASDAQIHFMEDRHLSDSYIRIQSEYQGKLKVIHQDGMLNFTLMGGCRVNIYHSGFFSQNKTKNINLYFECEKECSLVSEQVLKIGGELTVYSKKGEFNIHMAEVQAKSVAMDVFNGDILIHKLSVDSQRTGGNSLIQTSRGSIEINHINQDVELELESYTNYCLGGPEIQKASNESSEPNTYILTKSASATHHISLQAPEGELRITSIQKEGAPPLKYLSSSTQTTEGETVEMGFNAASLLGLNDIKKEFENDGNVDNAIILQTRNPDLKAADYQKWVITSNKAYFELKPWTFALLTLGLTQSAPYMLQPVIVHKPCPMPPTYDYETLKQLYYLINSTFHSQHRDKYIALISENAEVVYTTPLEGFWKDVDTEEWFYFLSVLTTPSLDDNPFLFGALIFSFLVAFAITSIALFWIVPDAYKLLSNICIKNAKCLFYNEIQNCYHIRKTAEYAEQRDKEIHQRKVTLPKYEAPPKGFFDKLKGMIKIKVSPFVLFDYIFHKLIGPFKNSLDEFLCLVPNYQPKSEKCNNKLIPIPIQKFAQLYGQYCYAKGLKEQIFTSTAAVKKLNAKGLQIVKKNRKVCTKIILKLKYNYQNESETKLNNEDSLEFFLRSRCTIENFEEDIVRWNHFMKEYKSFCLDKLLEEEEADSVKSTLKDCGVKLCSKSTCYIQSLNEDFNMKDLELRLKRIWDYRMDENNCGSLEKAKIFNQIVAKQQIAPRKGPRVREESMRGLMVALHIIATFLLCFPFTLLQVLGHIFYEPFAYANDDVLISKNDIMYFPWRVVTKLFSNQAEFIHLFLFAIILLFLVLHLSQIGSRYFMSNWEPINVQLLFPINLTRDKQESPVFWLEHVFQWIMIIVSLATLVVYLLLTVQWWILLAIINPTCFLPFATGIGGAFASASSKYKTFLKSRKDGQSYFNTILTNANTVSIRKMSEKAMQFSQRFLIYKNQHEDDEEDEEKEDEDHQAHGSRENVCVKLSRSHGFQYNHINKLLKDDEKYIEQFAFDNNIPSEILHIILSILNKNHKAHQEWTCKIGEKLNMDPILIEIIINMCFASKCFSPNRYLQIISNYLLNKYLSIDNEESKIIKMYYIDIIQANYPKFLKSLIHLETKGMSEVLTSFKYINSQILQRIKLIPQTTIPNEESKRQKEFRDLNEDNMLLKEKPKSKSPKFSDQLKNTGIKANLAAILELLKITYDKNLSPEDITNGQKALLHIFYTASNFNLPMQEFFNGIFFDTDLTLDKNEQNKYYKIINDISKKLAIEPLYLYLIFQNPNLQYQHTEISKEFSKLLSENNIRFSIDFILKLRSLFCEDLLKQMIESGMNEHKLLRESCELVQNLILIIEHNQSTPKIIENIFKNRPKRKIIPNLILGYEFTDHFSFAPFLFDKYQHDEDRNKIKLSPQIKMQFQIALNMFKLRHTKNYEEAIEIMEELRMPYPYVYLFIKGLIHFDLISDRLDQELIGYKAMTSMDLEEYYNNGHNRELLLPCDHIFHVEYAEGEESMKYSNLKVEKPAEEYPAYDTFNDHTIEKWGKTLNFEYIHYFSQLCVLRSPARTFSEKQMVLKTKSLLDPLMCKMIESMNEDKKAIEKQYEYVINFMDGIHDSEWRYLTFEEGYGEERKSRNIKSIISLSGAFINENEESYFLVELYIKEWNIRITSHLSTNLEFTKLLEDNEVLPRGLCSSFIPLGITEKPKIMSTNLDMIRISGIQEELSKLNVTKDEYQIYTAMHQLDFKEPIELAFKALFMASDPLALLDAQCKLFQKWEPRYYSVIISVIEFLRDQSGCFSFNEKGDDSIKLLTKNFGLQNNSPFIIKAFSHLLQKRNKELRNDFSKIAGVYDINVDIYEKLTCILMGNSEHLNEYMSGKNLQLMETFILFSNIANSPNKLEHFNIIQKSTSVKNFLERLGISFDLFISALKCSYGLMNEKEFGELVDLLLLTSSEHDNSRDPLLAKCIFHISKGLEYPISQEQSKIKAINLFTKCKYFFKYLNIDYCKGAFITGLVQGNFEVFDILGKEEGIDLSEFGKLVKSFMQLFIPTYFYYHIHLRLNYSTWHKIEHKLVLKHYRAQQLSIWSQAIHSLFYFDPQFENFAIDYIEALVYEKSAYIQHNRMLSLCVQFMWSDTVADEELDKKDWLFEWFLLMEEIMNNKDEFASEIEKYQFASLSYIENCDALYEYFVELMVQLSSGMKDMSELKKELLDMLKRVGISGLVFLYFGGKNLKLIQNKAKQGFIYNNFSRNTLFCLRAYRNMEEKQNLKIKSNHIYLSIEIIESINVLIQMVYSTITWELIDSSDLAPIMCKGPGNLFDHSLEILTKGSNDDPWNSLQKNVDLSPNEYSVVNDFEAIRKAKPTFQIHKQFQEKFVKIIMIPLIHKHADMLNRNLTSYCLLVGFAAGMNFPNIECIFMISNLLNLQYHKINLYKLFYRKESEYLGDLPCLGDKFEDESIPSKLQLLDGILHIAHGLFQWKENPKFLNYLAQKFTVKPETLDSMMLTDISFLSIQNSKKFFPVRQNIISDEELKSKILNLLPLLVNVEKEELVEGYEHSPEKANMEDNINRPLKTDDQIEKLIALIDASHGFKNGWNQLTTKLDNEQSKTLDTFFNIFDWTKLSIISKKDEFKDPDQPFSLLKISSYNKFKIVHKEIPRFLQQITRNQNPAQLLQLYSKFMIYPHLGLSYLLLEYPVEDEYIISKHQYDQLKVYMFLSSKNQCKIEKLIDDKENQGGLKFPYKNNYMFLKDIAEIENKGIEDGCADILIDKLGKVYNFEVSGEGNVEELKERIICYVEMLKLKPGCIFEGRGIQTRKPKAYFMINCLTALSDPKNEIRRVRGIACLLSFLNQNNNQDFDTLQQYLMSPNKTKIPEELRTMYFIAAYILKLPLQMIEPLDLKLKGMKSILELKDMSEKQAEELWRRDPSEQTMEEEDEEVEQSSTNHAVVLQSTLIKLGDSERKIEGTFIPYLFQTIPYLSLALKYRKVHNEFVLVKLKNIIRQILLEEWYIEDMEALKGFKELAYGLGGQISGDVLGMGDTDEIISTKVRQNAIITEFHKLFLNTSLPFSHTFFALLEIADAIHHMSHHDHGHKLDIGNYNKNLALIFGTNPNLILSLLHIGLVDQIGKPEKELKELQEAKMGISYLKYYESNKLNKLLSLLEKIVEKRVEEKKAFEKIEEEYKKKDDKINWEQLIHKIQNKDAQIEDLFNLLDKEGNSSGGISIDEFQVLCNRMNRDLNDHQLLELFSEVKILGISREDRKESAKLIMDELNEIEFKEAFNGMKRVKLQKNLESAKLDISSLAAKFLVFIVVLLLLLAFLFLGIKAFSVKGTVGSLVTSVMPLAAAFGFTKKGKKDDEKEVENLKKVSNEDMEEDKGEDDDDHDKGEEDDSKEVGANDED